MLKVAHACCALFWQSAPPLGRNQVAAFPLPGRRHVHFQGRAFSQAPIGQRRSWRGCSPLLSCVPADSATAYVRNGIASEADVLNAGARGRGRRYGGKFMRRWRSWKRREASAGYFKRFTAARASAICGSLAVEFSK